jgi:hypothetical protein
MRTSQGNTMPAVVIRKRVKHSQTAADPVTSRLDALLWGRSNTGEVGLIAPDEADGDDAAWLFVCETRLARKGQKLPANVPIGLEGLPIGVQGAINRDVGSVHCWLTLRAKDLELLFFVLSQYDADMSAALHAKARPGLVEMGIEKPEPPPEDVEDAEDTGDDAAEAESAPTEGMTPVQAEGQPAEAPPLAPSTQAIEVPELIQVQEQQDHGVLLEEQAEEVKEESGIEVEIPKAAPGLRWSTGYVAWEQEQLAKLRARRAAKAIAPPSPPPPDPSEEELMARAAEQRWAYDAWHRMITKIRAFDFRKSVNLRINRQLTAEELELPMPDHHVLFDLHHEQSMSPLTIAIMYNVPDLLVYVWFDRCGIKLKARAQHYLTAKVNIALGRPVNTENLYGIDFRAFKGKKKKRAKKKASSSPWDIPGL